MFDDMPTAFYWGFHFTQGAVVALALTFIFVYLINKIVELCSKWFTKEYDIKKHTFINLPYFYNSMSLKCDVKTKTVTATAVYTVRGKKNTRSYSTEFSDINNLGLTAQNAQLTLMTAIKKEHDAWIQSLD